MKRLLSYSLVYLSLLVALVSINMNNHASTSNGYDINTGSNEVTKSSISSVSFTTENFGIQNSNIEVNSLNGASDYKQPVFLLRLIRFKNITQQWLSNSCIIHLLNFELKQQRGFYLYQLCKLLI